MEGSEYSYTVLFEPAEEGGYMVTCPALPGVVTQGETLEEARAMAEDAIRGYLESLLKDGLSIPPDTPGPIKEKVKVVLSAASARGCPPSGPAKSSGRLSGLAFPYTTPPAATTTSSTPRSRGGSSRSPYTRAT